MLSRRSLSSSTTSTRGVADDMGVRLFAKTVHGARTDLARRFSARWRSPARTSAGGGRAGQVDVVGVRAVVSHSLEQVVEVDGFAQAGAERELVGHLLSVREARESHDGDRRKGGLGELSAAELVTVHARHLQVEEDHARVLAGSEHVEGGFATRRGQDAVALLRDDVPEDSEEVFVVVHDENGRSRFGGHGICLNFTTETGGGRGSDAKRARGGKVSREGLEPST